MEAIQQASQQTQPQGFEPTQALKATTQALLKKRQSQNNTFSPAVISQAMAELNPGDNNPQAQIGKAIQTPNYAGKCLQWVDDQEGNENRQPTAYADYQIRSQAGQVNISNKIPQGARVYFSPNDSNGGLGHVGIANGDGTFTSATDNGVKTFKISDWEKATGQTILGWSKSKN